MGKDHLLFGRAGTFRRAVRLMSLGLAASWLAAFGISTEAAAKPTGWMSELEMKGSSAAQAWAGYSDSGYTARPTKRTSKQAYKSKKNFASEYAPPKKIKGKRYAALGNTMIDASPPAKSLTGGGVRWAASSSCLNGTLVSMVGNVASNFGPVTVTSTCRSKGHNAKVGGAKHSQHLTGDAVDFRLHGNYGGVVAYLRSSGSIGGVKHYGGGLFHMDTGPRRSW